jgi:hypothetical protein
MSAKFSNHFRANQTLFKHIQKTFSLFSQIKFSVSRARNNKNMDT